MTEFRQLKGLLSLAASNPNDAEAIAAFRKATDIVTRNAHTWVMVLDKLVKVIDEVEDGATYGSGEINRTAPASEPRGDDDDWDRLFEGALAGTAEGSFRDTLLDMQTQWDRRRWLSDRQRGVVRAAAERWAERHQGGRVR